MTEEERAKILRDLKQEAELRQKLNTSIESYIEGLKDSGDLQKEINRLTEIQKELEDKIAAAGENALQDDINKLEVLKQQTKEIKNQKKVLDGALKEAKVKNLLFAKGSASILKTFTKLPSLVERGFGKIKGYGLFEMDKAMKTTALSIGLSDKRTESLRFNIKEAAKNTVMFGDGIAELSTYQANYSEELGRSVILSQKGLESISAIAKGTALGAEGAAKIAAEFEQQGLSAERTKDFVEEAVNNSVKMGLNASKILKNIQVNVKLLNKYNFKEGRKGLEKMAQTVAKLGVEMDFAAGMAEKLFDIEGAVEMSAQLQVLGGAWSQLSDPFRLMYMARNDMAGLTEEIGNAAMASAKFNSQNGQMEISALEMQRLRKIAEQTGLQYEDLATAAKNAAKFTRLKTQISFAADKDTKEFLSNTAQLDEKGRGYIEIMVDGKSTKRYLNELNQTQINQLMQDKKTLEERAKQARTFDEAINNVSNRFKMALLPFVEKISEKGGLIDSLDGFIRKMSEEKWFEKIEEFAKYVGGIIETVGSFIIKNPIASLITYLSGWALLKAATWYSYGVSLGMGFNTVTGGINGIKGMATNFAKVAGPLLGIGVGTSLGMASGKAISKFAGNKDTKAGDTAGLIGGLGLGAAGWAVGAALAPATGGLSLLIPALAALGGAYVGSTAGKSIGDYAASDAIFSSPVKDGLFETSMLNNMAKKFGPNYSENRAIIQGGKITPIDNKDDVLAMKPGGMVDKMTNKSSGINYVKHEFGDLNINGEIKLLTPNNEKIDVDVLKDPQFIREITRLIQVEARNINNQSQKP